VLRLALVLVALVAGAIAVKLAYPHHSSSANDAARKSSLNSRVVTNGTPSAPVTPTANPSASAATQLTVTPDQQAKCGTSAIACVDLVAKIAWMQRNGTVNYGPVPIQPGPEHTIGKFTPTPRGHWHVEWKDADHVSSVYHEPMTNAVFFAPDGVAFHEGSLTDMSHGCVHLSPDASKAFFDNLKRGDGVVVF
jgi:lipoprotein-anchoring transpeptidase ErfK/SrfK